MIDALHAEWTKLRTVGGTGWLVLAAVVLTVAVSAITVAATSYPSAGTGLDPAKVSLTGVELGQAVVAVLAVLAISGEYGTGMIRSTLTAIPHRGAVLAAKAATLAGVVLATGTVAVLGCLVVGRLILPGNGVSTAHGFTPLTLGDGPTLRAMAGSVLYLVLIALLSLGVATAVRESATAMGLVLALFYVFPVLAHAVSDPHWQRHLDQLAPTSAGLAIQKTVVLAGAPISPWAGLGVLAAWAAGALLAGGLVLRLRDA